MHGLRSVFLLILQFKLGGIISRLLEFLLSVLRCFGRYDDRSVVFALLIPVRSCLAAQNVDLKINIRYNIYRVNLCPWCDFIFVIPAGFLVQTSAFFRSRWPSHDGRGDRV